MAEYKFIVNTENVNSYGYRIITEGIDITQYDRNPVVLFMHDRGDYKQNGATGDEVIGKARLVKENNMLLAFVTFDSKNEFASKIEGKVAGGFINMCSMYAEPKESTLDPNLVLPGQQYETVTKCKLIEISIVDIGGNDDALRLSAGSSKHKLKLLNQNKMSELKMIALALGKSADSNENSVLEGIQALKLSLETEKGKTTEWKNKYIELQKKEATALVDKAVKLGLFPEDLKDGQISLFENDFEGQHLKLSKLIDTKEAEVQKNGKKETVEGVIKLSHKNNESEEGSEESFDYLQKHDPAKLKLMRENEPEKYRKLSLEYGNGVRYKSK